jgi:protein-disulfide isomerase
MPPHRLGHHPVTMIHTEVSAAQQTDRLAILRSPTLSSHDQTVPASDAPAAGPDTPGSALLEPLEAGIDHVRGPDSSPVILEYGDYECPYSRRAFREIERVERAVEGGVRFAFRHYPLVQIHPHALAAAGAAEAAASQDRFWDMHEMLFHRQKHLEDSDLRRYAQELGLDVARFDADVSGGPVMSRVGRDVGSGRRTGEVRGTPTLFVNGVLHRGDYDAATLIEAISSDPTR